MHLQHAERGRFAEYTGPGRGVEFVGTLVERKWIRAVRAAERTTMSKLGKQAEGRGHTGAVRRHGMHVARSFPRKRESRWVPVFMETNG
jgi:hypothetical protein